MPEAPTAGTFETLARRGSVWPAANESWLSLSSPPLLSRPQRLPPRTRFAAGVDQAERLLLADAQTSGGLLFAVPPELVARAVAELEERATPACAVVGELREGPAGEIEVVG